MKPTRLDLERWIVGDLDEQEREALEAAFEQDAGLRARADALRRDAQALNVPPMKRPRSRAWRRAAWGWGPLVGVAVALLALVVVTRPSGVTFRGQAFELEMMHVRLSNVQPVGAVVETRSGDRLQWTIESELSGYVHVFDVQGDGVVQTWMPATRVGARQVVEGAVLLDDYVGEERVYVLVGPRALTVDDVADALSRAHRVPLAELDALPGLGREVGQRSILILDAL